MVLASTEEDVILRAKADKRGITVSRLLMESALEVSGKNRTLLLQQVALLRQEVAKLQRTEQLRFEEPLNWSGE